MWNPFSNMQQAIEACQQFSQSSNIDPATARQNVQGLLNSGRMSQEQLNQILPLAEQIYQMMYGGGNGRKHS